MSTPQELHKQLANPQVAAQIVTFALSFSNATTADLTVQGFKATRKMRLIKASYQQTADATAVTTYTAQLKNGSVAMTDALDIKGIAATAGADFVISTVAGATTLADGDVLTVVFDETGGTVTAPGIVGILLEFMLLA